MASWIRRYLPFEKLEEEARNKGKKELVLYEQT